MRLTRYILGLLLTITLISVIAVSGLGCAEAENVLRVNLGGNPTSLDPQKTSSARDLSVAVQVFDGLIGFNQDLTLKPVVAREVPTTQNGGISQDGLVYTFKLREDVTWSDGEPVTAGDFVYSIRRLFATETRAPYRGVYYVIENAIPYRKGEVTAEEIGVSAPDDYTLEIRLTGATPSFLNRMALWAVYPLRQDVIETHGDDWASNPDSYIGNGPFILKEWVADDHITLEKNANYWGEQTRLDGVRYSMYEDAATEYLAYRSGELDISRIPVGTERTLTDSVELLTYSQLKTNALFFDCGEPPFDNEDLRRAFALAIDRAALVEDVQGGRGSVTYCWMPPGMPGYASGYQETTGNQYAFNPDKAKQMLADAGYPDGEGLPPITLVYSNVASNPTIAQFVQGQLSENLGINVDAVGVGQAVYWSRVFGEHDKWDLSYVSFSADYPDPDNWLPDFFETNGGYNGGIAQYSSEELDAKIADALAASGSDTILRLWKEAEKIMVEDAPAIFLFNDEMFVLVNERVQGITGTAMDLYIPGDLLLESIFLE